MEILEVNMPVGMAMEIDVLENLKRTKMARAQEKTKEELAIITGRVERIIDDYELGEQMFSHPPAGSNIQFLADMAELQSIVNDAIKKNKYQQKIAIFIVGFQESCSQRMHLLNQISEFFETYGAPDEINDIGEDSLHGLDVVEINENIQTAIDTMDSAFTKLNDLNHDIVECMNSMHSALSSKSMKNRKKLEKNLSLAKEDLLKITEKLHSAQQELKTKDDQNQKLTHQIENKSKEVFNIKSQLDSLRKNFASELKENNNAKFMLEDELRKLRGQLEIQSTQLREFQNQKASSLSTVIQEIFDASLDELVHMKATLNEDEESQVNFRKEISLQYRVQSRHIEHLQSEDLAQLLFEFRKKLSQKLEIEVTEDDIQQWGMEEEQEPEHEDHEENISPPPETPGSALEHGFDTPVSAQLSENASSPISPRQMGMSSVEPLQQPIDLTDEELWDNISDKEMSVRFAEFRFEALRQIDELRSAVSQASNEELIQKQRNDKRKWKEERSTLLDHIQQLQRLQEEAESDANEAMQQLEEVAAQLDELQRSKAEDDAARQSSTDENFDEARDNISSREQGTSPDLPASTPKKSVVHLVEEKRAAMMKRKENAPTLHTNTSKNSTSGDESEKVFQSYKSVLKFKKHITGLLSGHPSSQQKLSQGHDQEMTETEDMLQGLENTLTSVELAIKTLLGSLSLNDNTAPKTTFHSRSSDGHEIEDLRNRIAELQSEMQSMRLQYDRRAQQDSEIIQQLHHSLANGKQDNIPNNMKITTNTPSAPAPVGTDHSLSVNRGHRSHPVDPSVTMMFTRLDSQHNTKTLLNSTKTGRINQETLDSLVLTMEGYNEIASTRLQQLVQKIVHHTKMKEIEVNVRNSNLVTSEVFEILEKMEDLQRRRAEHWSRQMDELSAKRQNLGLLLQDAMQRLEKITGVFLIKPIISFGGKVKSRRYSGKISTKFNKYQVEAMAAKELSRRMEYGDISARMSSPRYNPLPSRGIPWTAQSMPPTAVKQTERDGLTISGLTRVNPPSMWNVGASLPQSVPTTKNEKWSSGNFVMPSSVPRLVELDVGRFLHEINPVHTLTAMQGNSPRGIPGPSRLYNGVPRSRGSVPKAAISKINSGKRSKVLIKSPAVETVKSESSAEDYQSTAPPTTPASQIQLRLGSTTTPVGSDRGSLETPNLPRPLPPIQVPSRSQASSRSSLTNSPLKNLHSPSPLRSPNIKPISPAPRDDSNLSTPVANVEESTTLPSQTKEVDDL